MSSNYYSLDSQNIHSLTLRLIRYRDGGAYFQLGGGGGGLKTSAGGASL